MKKFTFLTILFLSTSLFAQQVGTIKKITMKQDANRFNVFISGDGKLECNTLVMDNPPRIALDFPNIKNALYPNVLQPESNPFVDRIHTSLYAKGRDTISRITVDLKAKSDYSVYKTKEGLVLSLTIANKTTNTTKPGATTAAAKPGTTTPSTKTPTTSTTTMKPPVFVPPPAPENIQDIVIGNEDLIEVTVFELPQFNTTARVQGDGTITMPLVGSIEVRGLKKKDVEAKIAQALAAKYVNNPNVSVNVKEYKSRQVTILGMVKSPGPYYVMSQRTLLQLLSEAGGLAPGAGNKGYVFRQGSPKIEINLFELINNGNPDYNIPIYPGDVINIPGDQKITVYVFGAVKNPGAVQISISMPTTLLAVIAQAGGFTDQAKQSDVKIKRKTAAGTETLIKANMKDILKGKTPDVQIFEGDVITVSESFF
jgi:polysaccharide biosynthesis/export protein